MLRRLLCRMFGHNYKATAEFKRRCTRCHNEQWLFSNPFPLLGEPKYYWKDMNFDRLKF